MVTNLIFIKTKKKINLLIKMITLSRLKSLTKNNYLAIIIKVQL